MTNQHQQDPLNEFAATVYEIDQLLAKLQSHSDNQFDVDPEAVNWGHVGDAKQVKSVLQQALNFIEGKEKYEPRHRSYRFGVNLKD